jgi:F-type H+-transporting ATPase subunit b
MPQLNQLALVAYSQLFWLLLVLAVIYFGIGKLMLPKIQSTVEARDKRIADDLAAAQAARVAADETEAAYRARIDESRAEAL